MHTYRYIFMNIYIYIYIYTHEEYSISYKTFFVWEFKIHVDY